MSKKLTILNMGVLIIYIFLCEYQTKNSNILNSYEISVNTSEKHDLHHLVKKKCPLHHFSEKNDQNFKVGFFKNFEFFHVFNKFNICIIEKNFFI
jgi:hypothetical protein